MSSETEVTEGTSYVVEDCGVQAFFFDVPEVDGIGGVVGFGLLEVEEGFVV